MYCLAPVNNVTDSFGRSRSSKVIYFGTNRKRVCDFLLVRHNNLGPILHRFGDITGFCAPEPTPIPPWFRGCSRWNQIAHVGVSVSRCLKLFGREIIFEVITVAERYRQTTYCRVTALCVASRAKN